MILETMSYLSAAKHKVLPDENTEFVASVVKHVVLVDPSSPNPYHVLVSVDKELEPCAVSLGGDVGEEVVGWDPVRA